MKKNKENKKKRSKIFINYSTKDFTMENLPHNRVEVFLDLLKSRWRVLLGVGAIMFLFSLPLIGSILGLNLISSSLYASYLEGKIEAGVYHSNLFFLNIAFSLINLICLLIISIPLSGIERVYKIMVYYEPLDFKADFFKGIKDNIVQTLVLSLVSSFVFTLSTILVTFLLSSGSKGFASTLAFFAPLFLFFIFILPSFLLSTCSTPIYKNSLWVNFRNGFLLYFSTSLPTLGFCLIVIAPLFLLLLGNLYVILITLSLYFLIYFPLSFLCFYIYSTYVFDKCINKTSYPDLVDKGIYRIKKK